MKNELNKTIISITHDMEEVYNADRVLVMNNGKIVKFCTPTEFFSNTNFLSENSLDLPLIANIAKKLNIDNEIIFTTDELINKIIDKYGK
jgi:energy-coupling factor transport system ATP-binding protein